VCHAAKAREVLVGRQLLGAVAQAQHVSVVDIAQHQLVKQMIERRVAVRHDQNALVRMGVVQIGHNLRRAVRLAGAGRANDQRQTRQHAAQNRVALARCEAHRVAQAHAERQRRLVR
jgi:hypothetical protein